MFTGKLLKPEISFDTGAVIIRAELTAGNFREWYASQNTDKEFDIEFKQHRKRRSLDANSYFHVLVAKIADKLGTSKTEVKNRMIALYGQPVILENGKLDYMIVRDDLDVGKFNELHLQATPQTRELNGTLYRVYIRMRNTGWNHKGESVGYDSREMAALISGTISEAREIGLSDAEIMSTREKQILKEIYGL